MHILVSLSLLQVGFSGFPPLCCFLSVSFFFFWLWKRDVSGVFFFSFFLYTTDYRLVVDFLAVIWVGFSEQWGCFLVIRMFKECPHPDEKQRLQLSRDLGLEPRQIKFWFQNRRTQMKVDCFLKWGSFKSLIFSASFCFLLSILGAILMRINGPVTISGATWTCR